MHLQVRHSRFVEHRSNRLVTVPTVEFERRELSAQDDPNRFVSPRLRLELSKELGSNSEAAVRLKNRHPTDFRPTAVLSRGRLHQHHQPARPDCVSTFDGQHVVGPGVFVVALDSRRHMLLLDEHHLANRERLQQLPFGADRNNRDIFPFRTGHARGPYTVKPASSTGPKKDACAKARAMASLVLAGILLLALFLVLALFTRGGPTETIAAKGLPPELSGIAKLSLHELGSVANRLFNELGFQTVSQNTFPDRYDLIVEDPTPITGQRIYIRCVLTPEAGAVQSAEVQAALDTARGENLAKAEVITTGAFSNEAKLVSQQTAVELIDGATLAGLIRKHLPDVANRLGLPR